MGEGEFRLVYSTLLGGPVGGLGTAEGGLIVKFNQGKDLNFYGKFTLASNPGDRMYLLHTGMIRSAAIQMARRRRIQLRQRGLAWIVLV